MIIAAKQSRIQKRFFGISMAALVWLLIAGSAFTGEVHFIYTSDQHYGISRKEFRGQKDVPSDVVNAAMIEALNKFVAMTFPADNGVMACKKVNGAEYVISAGDIANRMEGTNPAETVTATKCWEMFARHYLEDLAVKNSSGAKAEVLVIPGNHDATNALGFFRAMTPSTDNHSMVAMYNRATGDSLQAADFEYTKHKVFLSRDLAGVRLFVIQMWPDSEMRARLDREIASLPSGTPVILITHIQPDIDANRLTNPNGNHDINANDKFENLVSDISSVKTTKEIPIKERRELAQFIKSHPAIIAYFHGHEHGNTFYDWKGPDGDVSLPTFMVDSPMKGVASNKDETKVSFQSVAIDTEAKRMTVREVRWNINPESPIISWGDSHTFSFK